MLFRSNNIHIETENLNEIYSLISEKQEELDIIQTRINNLQFEIDIVQSEILSKELSIAEKNADIDSKNEEIYILEVKELETRDILDKRIITYYKTGVTTNYLLLLLDSDSFSDFFNSLFSIYKIMKTDKELIARYNENRLLLEELKSGLERIVVEIEEEKAIIEEEELALISIQDEIILEKIKENENMAYLSSLEEAKENLIYVLNVEKQNLDEQIEDLISFNADLQAELTSIMNNANVGNDSSVGVSSEGFLRPTPGIITCDYGFRYDPISGEPGFHTGTDFGDWYGTPIKASKSGTVQYSGWINGYGNSVVINHGNGQQTLYAHAESLNVYVGQYVSQGDVIAYVGSTGWSTGPHLHFEIRINGSHVNPMLYL